MKIQKGDTVKVISGKDTGKEGKVLQAFPKKGTVLVEGVNINKKHQKPQGQTMQGGVIDKSMPGRPPPEPRSAIVLPDLIFGIICAQS